MLGTCSSSKRLRAEIREGAEPEAEDEDHEDASRQLGKLGEAHTGTAYSGPSSPGSRFVKKAGAVPSSSKRAQIMAR